MAAFHLLVLIAAGSTSCDRPGTADAPKNVPAEVRLGYFANVAHAQALLGVQSGDFQRAVAPARLTHRIFNAGPSLIEALLADELDIGYVGPGPVINAFARTRGTGLRVIAAASANGVVVVARGDSNIKILADLKGRRIATPQLGNTQDISARHYLLQSLGQADTNNVIAIPNAEQIGLMARGEIDAAWAPEPWGARLVAEAGGRIIAEEKDLWPEREFTLAVVITTPRFLERNRAVAQKFLAAHQAWTGRLVSDPNGCIAPFNDAMRSETGKPMSSEILRSALQRTRFTSQPNATTFTTVAAWSREVGFIRQTPDLTGLIDLTLLPSHSAD